MPRKPRTGRIYRPWRTFRNGERKQTSIWMVRYYRDGKRFEESTHSDSWDEAERFLKRRLGETVTGRFAGTAPERIRLGALLDLVLEDYAGKRSEYDTRMRLERHVRPAIGDVRAADFGSSHLKRYIRDRQGAAPATINRELAIIQRAFKLGLQHDPPLVTREPHIAKLPESNTREGFLERAQYEALLRELPQYLKPLLVVGYHTGARLGELRSIRVEQVDLKAKTITLSGKQTKNAQPRILPIYGDMGPRIEMQLTDIRTNWPNCRWLFHLVGRQLKNNSHRKSWISACRRANLPGLLFHDLRRSAIRNMVRAGVSEKVAMTVSGHKQRTVFERYNIVSERDLQMVGPRVEAYFAEQEKPAPPRERLQ